MDYPGPSNTISIDQNKEREVTLVELTAGVAALALLIGIVTSGIGGAIGGMATGGKAIGNQLAAMMGSFYGPVGGAAGIVVGLILLALIG